MHLFYYKIKLEKTQWFAMEQNHQYFDFNTNS